MREEYRCFGLRLRSAFDPTMTVQADIERLRHIPRR
jgi:hypothetical protein